MDRFLLNTEQLIGLQRVYPFF